MMRMAVARTTVRAFAVYQLHFFSSTSISNLGPRVRRVLGISSRKAEKRTFRAKSFVQDGPQHIHSSKKVLPKVVFSGWLRVRLLFEG